MIKKFKKNLENPKPNYIVGYGKPPIPPYKVIDWEVFDRLCYIQCTQVEISAFFQCTEEAIVFAVEREKGMTFKEYCESKKYKKNLENGKLKHAGGRPREEIDYYLLSKLCVIQCTDEEIAACLNIHIDTLQKKKNNDPQFFYIYKKAKEHGKMSLRRKMYAMANAGNATMCIWLSKQYMGMMDKMEQTIHANAYINRKTEDLEKEAKKLEQDLNDINTTPKNSKV